MTSGADEADPPRWPVPTKHAAPPQTFPKVGGDAGGAEPVRGVRRVGWADQVEDAGRTTAQTVVEGLIVLAVLVVGVLVLVALLD